MSQAHVHDGQGGSSVAIAEPVPVLQLRGAANNQQTRELKGDQRSKVHWKEDVVDNEHMDKKKSKICCIFHPQQHFENPEGHECDHSCHDDHSDSSSSSSSSSSSESEAENAKGLDLESRRRARKQRRHCKLQQKRSTSPNAYEIQPDYSKFRDRYAKAGDGATQA
ncbi:LAME_0A03862g1_1 [Lachancea meyersii CBS 8951]|uniref:Type 1 phosphatases regulator n=1 Tax=Lachancea meyersii CBS 8951 TaxID=1266667 RepID=A0A1G4INP1_9SACH|nr:LAME_0A03862g1_1 [Lachancea meyersii CBS 8951]